MTIKADIFDMGTACTVLLTRDAIDNENPMMIANCDQYIDANINSYLAAQQSPDELIMTIWADDPKRLFARRNAEGRATGVVERKRCRIKQLFASIILPKGATFCVPEIP